MAKLDEQFPWIKWDEPIAVSNPEGPSRLGCRRCIAAYGLRGDQVKELFADTEAFETHRVQFHGADR